MSLRHISYIVYSIFREKIVKKIIKKINNLNSLALLLEISDRTFSALLNSNISE